MPTDPTWTREPPTEVGWYWHRNGPGTRYPKIVFIYRFEDGKALRFAYGGQREDLATMLKKNPESEFAGPLAPPREPPA